MAETEAKEEEEKEKKPKNMLMIIIIVVLVFIIIVGVLFAVFFLSDDAEPMQNMQQEQEKSQPKKRLSSSNYDRTRQLDDIGILYPMDTFTVNLKSDSGRRFLKVGMSLELDGEELSLELDAKAPVLRDRIIRILTSKTLEEISSKKGKSKVSNEIIDTLNAMIKDGDIRAIYFTEFVIQ
ncbi:flagellar basal body-associated protein FliL [uncultured Sulfurimonas sp.]|jgi:flagellar protein FliL|uniref:flagellar basal body-associated protein FliL n=1 Tax=uncultured Sulfurimonas sp. TaxID=291845 RepID=UPI0032B25629